MNEKRAMVAIFGIAVAAVAGYIAYRFIAALTVAVFLYYSTRRFYKALARLRLPRRIRAATVISFLGLPLILLISYTVVLVVLEVRELLEAYPAIGSTAEEFIWLEDVENLPELTLEGLITAYQAGNLDVFINFAAEHAGFLASLITGFLLNLLIVVVVTYYLLIDGGRVHQWLLKFDDDAIVREYLEAADDELEAVLFGNLLNVIVISLIAVVVYMGYNTIAPAGAQVPAPALAGALTGLASLIPVVGMKIVYLPLAGAAAAPIFLDGGDMSLLVYILGFLVVALVLVDTIPDLVLRPYFSGKRTHVGLLMLAYIFGPVVFGFYGLFFAPIILVLGLTFADTALPQLLGADNEDEGLPAGQRRLDEFGTVYSDKPNRLGGVLRRVRGDRESDDRPTSHD